MPHINVRAYGYNINIHKTNWQTETIFMTIFTGIEHYILLKLNACQLLRTVVLPAV